MCTDSHAILVCLESTGIGKHAIDTRGAGSGQQCGSAERDAAELDGGLPERLEVRYNGGQRALASLRVPTGVNQGALCWYGF